MTTPICDFVRQYAASVPGRLHMPGHKGNVRLGPEPLDITEIPGADVLYASTGIIRESEENTARLFGSVRTVYSAEGSSLSIRAMLYLAQMHAALRGKRLRIAAGRNAHRVFTEAAALLDPEVVWLSGTRAAPTGVPALLTCLLCFTAGAYYDPSNDKSFSVFEAVSSLDRRFIEAHSEFAALRLFQNGLSGYISMFLPIIVAFPFMVSFCAERNNGLMRFTITRAGKLRYYLSKFTASLLGGGLAGDH